MGRKDFCRTKLKLKFEEMDKCFVKYLKYQEKSVCKNCIQKLICLIKLHEIADIDGFDLKAEYTLN